MRWFLVLCFLSFFLQATCTNEQKDKAKQLYISASIDKVLERKIEILQQALTSCYAPEIEANLFILKARHSKDINVQVRYYKKSLISISKFKDKSSIIKYQNEINNKLATLLKQIKPQLSKIYDSKEIQVDTDPDKKDSLWIYIILGLLFLWGIYKNFR